MKNVMQILSIFILCLTVSVISSSCSTSLHSEQMPAPTITTGTTTTPTSTTTISSATITTTTTTSTPSTTTTPTSTSSSNVTSTTLSGVASEVDFADFDWGKITAMRVLHTQSPPRKAITLKRGEEEFDALLAILKQLKGTYMRSSEGIYGGFEPVLLHVGDTQVERIAISITDWTCFSVDTQRVPSDNANVTGTYPCLYTMSETLKEQFLSFYESLEYTEDYLN